MAMRRPGPRGFSLPEVAVLIAILAILLAIGTPIYFRYRASAAVNTAAETAEGLLSRCREEAKASGYALPDDLVASGVSTAAPAGVAGMDGGVTLRIRKRYRAGEPLQTVTIKDLSLSGRVGVEVVGLGQLDLDGDTSLEGVYFEILVKQGGSTTALATLPVDVNGEFIMQGSNTGGAIRFSSGSYNRLIALTRRGVVNPDRR
jgi:prepilin-type N-terminal cleavage/methylation domain-containing protein